MPSINCIQKRDSTVDDMRPKTLGSLNEKVQLAVFFILLITAQDRMVPLMDPKGLY